MRCTHGHPIELVNPDLISIYFDGVLGVVDTARDELKKFLAFVKTFKQKEFSTIYCEREWRSIKDFPFDLEDIAMIVVPKTEDLFKRFIEEIVPKVHLPRSVPVVPWEDLIEH